MSAERSEAILAQLEAYLKTQRREHLRDWRRLGGCFDYGGAVATQNALDMLRELRAADTCEYELGAGWHCVRGCEKHGR